MTRLAPLPLLLLALAACQPMAGAPPAAGPVVEPVPGEMRPVLPAPAEDTCGAARATTLIGQPEAAAAALPEARVIRPGDVVTMEFSAARLNLEIDPSGRIDRAYCG